MRPGPFLYGAGKVVRSAPEILMATVTISSKGQIVLPKRLREEMSIREGDRLELSREDDRLVLRPVVQPARERDWKRWRGVLSGTDALADHVREHRADVERDRLP
jgi:AbrB family looped-hinge helix DNA binding protein